MPHHMNYFRYDATNLLLFVNIAMEGALTGFILPVQRNSALLVFMFILYYAIDADFVVI